MENEFSNPEDPFAKYCHSMASDMRKVELFEQEYSQALHQHFVRPIKQFKEKEFNDIYPLQLKYNRIQKKHSKTTGRQRSRSSQGSDINTLHELNDTKDKLKFEINRISKKTNGPLLKDVDKFWKAFVDFNKRRGYIIAGEGSVDNDDKKQDDNDEMEKSSEIIEQLKTFGYDEDDIKNAMDNVTNKEDINEIKEYIDDKLKVIFSCTFQLTALLYFFCDLLKHN